MISAIVITKNEEKRLMACLESLKWADEIIIADNGSTDETLKIAEKYTQKIVKVNGSDFATLRNKAFEKSVGDWIFYVDADERVLESLKEEVLTLISNTNHSAFAVSRRNIIFGQEEKYGPFWPDWVIRILKRDQFETWTGKVHEQPKFKGSLGYTKHSLLHLTHRNIDQIVLKSLEWANIDAKLRLEANHPKMSSWRFLRILFSELFSQGVKRRGFFGGSIGMMDSLLQTFSMLLTYMKLWELQQKMPLEEQYLKIDKKLIEDGFTNI